LPPTALETILVPDLYGTPLGPILPKNPLSPLVFPMVSYWELGFYLGILPLFLVVSAFIFQRTKYVGLFLFLALFSLLFSFGRYFPLYGMFYHFIPGFSMFRIPARMLFVFTFSLAIIAGFGIDAVFDKKMSLKQRFGSFFGKPMVHLACVCIAAAGGLLIIVSLLTPLFDPKYLVPLFFVWVAFAALFCLAPLFLKSNKPVKLHLDLLKVILISILIVDLFSFGISFIDTKSPADVFKNPDFVNVIKNETDPYFRIYDETGLLNQNIAYRNNLYLINGYDPTYLKEYQSFFIRSQSVDYSGYSEWMQGARIKDFNILRLLNVRYIVTNQKDDSDFDVPGFQCVYNNDSIFVYRLNVTDPRAYLISVSEFSNTTPVFVQPAPIERYSPNTIIVNVTTKDPKYLIISEIYYPGWTARDNAEPVDIVRYQSIFRAVYLIPGSHRVTFTYFPKILSI
jgi:hypothetical protein